jgi:redox-sensitive bicupin YhaK (pirin superfamily)
LIASPDAARGSTLIHQNARLHAAHLEAGHELGHALAPAPLAYVHLVRGAATLNGAAMQGGDGAKIAAESALHFVAGEDSEILFFELPH